MSIFKSYDVRGLYPQQINEKITKEIGRAFVEFLGKTKIVVGRDMRTSSPKLYNALVNGLIEQGAQVINIGMSSTPMFYYAVNKLEADGGIMITASHNPGEYNGLKFVKSKAKPISENDGLKEIEKIANEKTYNEPKSYGEISNKDVEQDYIGYVKTYAHNIKGLKIVLDYGNGMGGKTIPKLLQNFDIEIINIYEELDGTFPNHQADPLKDKCIEDLQKRVIKEKADAGFSFDGDVDRVAMIDEKGERVSGDITTAIIAREMLKKSHEKIAYDPRSTKALKELIREKGGIPVVTRVGHSHIKKKMIEEGIFFGGELSGHYFFKENFYTDSAEIALIYLLSILSKEKKKVSEIVKEIKKYHHTGEINKEIEDKDEAMKRIEEHYNKLGGRISHPDGLLVEFDDWWFNLRKSNTEPLIRLNLEADTKKLMEEKKEEVLKLIY